MKLEDRETKKTTTVKKGFGAIKPASSQSNQIDLEKQIQTLIDKESGLREAMSLYNDIESYECKVNNCDIIQLSNLSNDIKNSYKLKKQRLLELESIGWNKVSIHNKLLQITWDASAYSRNLRHIEKSHDISMKIDFHMKYLSKLILISEYSTTSNDNVPGVINTDKKILDVGCGTGILFKYMKELSTIDSNWYGLDLSNEMISICKHSYPIANFIQTDFLEYNPDPISFNVIIFNESLHNFLNVNDALRHAYKLLNKNPGDRIVISHPKGYDNVIKQKSHNKWLVPNLLPIQQDLESFGKNNHMNLLIKPNIKDLSYLAVLECF